MGSNQKEKMQEVFHFPQSFYDRNVQVKEEALQDRLQQLQVL